MLKVGVLFLFALVVSCLGGPPPGYYDSTTGKTGADLRAALHEIIDDHVVLSYSGGTNNTTEALKVLDEDANNTNNVFLLYAQRSEPKSTFGTTAGWNREHEWPNSYGLDDHPPDFTDLFNLRAEDTHVNSARGNKPYDISNPADPSYRQPAHAEAPLCSTDSDTWEPPANVKGDIARALFYIDLRYSGDRTNEIDLVLTDDLSQINTATNFMGRLSTLILWNEQDPVDAGEMRRNDLIFQKYQGNRNPFIDNPEWVNSIFKPAIRIARAGAFWRLSWPAEFPISELQKAAFITGPWSPASGSRSVIGNETVQMEPGGSQSFFRLKLR